MRFSILDQSPIPKGKTARDALEASLELAQLGEKLGYTRYWIAEHHDLAGLASSAPEVMLGYIGAHTSSIRIGSGAILLPYYKPFKVAETYHTLATLFPDRIDIGIGRAPGGSAEASHALSDHYLKGVWAMPEAVKTLCQFIDNTYVPDNQHATLSASPLPDVAPIPWLLGTSKKSAILAAENGLGYTFGYFMSDQQPLDILRTYKEAFQPRKNGQLPYTILTVAVVCAETTQQAEAIALSNLVWSIQKDKGEGQQGVPSILEAQQYVLSEKERKDVENRKQKMIIGSPSQVKEKLQLLQQQYLVDEIMIVTITHDFQHRLQSYEYIMN